LEEKKSMEAGNFNGEHCNFTLYLARGYVMLLDKPSLIHSSVQCMPLLVLETFALQYLNDGGEKTISSQFFT